MQPRPYRENEIFNYWAACQMARHGEDRASGYNEMYGIATNTDWPKLAKMSANALLSPDAAAVLP